MRTSRTLPAAGLVAAGLTMTGCIAIDDTPLADPSTAAAPQSSAPSEQEAEADHSDGGDQSSDAGESSNQSGEGPGVELVPDDESTRVLISAQQGFSPYIERWTIHDGEADEDSLHGVELEYAEFNCAGVTVRESRWSLDAERYEDDEHRYGAEKISGDAMRGGGGNGGYLYNIMLDDAGIRYGLADDEPATADHAAAVAEFGEMCGDVAEFILP